MGSDFSVVPRNKIGGNGHKLKHKKFHLNVRGKNISTVRVSEHWNKLLVVGSPSLGVLKTCLDKIVQPAVGEPALTQGLEVISRSSLLSSQPFCDFF